MEEPLGSFQSPFSVSFPESQLLAHPSIHMAPTTRTHLQCTMKHHENKSNS